MAAVERLGERERDILERRYGSFRNREKLKSIGAAYGLTRERIRQIARDAIRRVRRALVADQ